MAFSDVNVNDKFHFVALQIFIFNDIYSVARWCFEAFSVGTRRKFAKSIEPSYMRYNLNMKNYIEKFSLLLRIRLSDAERWMCRPPTHWTETEERNKNPKHFIFLVPVLYYAEEIEEVKVRECGSFREKGKQKKH